MNLKKILETFGEKAAEATVQCLNDAIKDIEDMAKDNLHANGIKGTTMYNSFEQTEATTKKPTAMLAVEIWSKKPVKNPGSRNPSMRGRYKKGYANIGRLIEFSPRINKPFYYKAFYKRRKTIESEIIEAIRKVTANVNRKS